MDGPTDKSSGLDLVKKEKSSSFSNSLILRLLEEKEEKECERKKRSEYSCKRNQ